jgi:hypothetical protein
LFDICASIACVRLRRRLGMLRRGLGFGRRDRHIAEQAEAAVVRGFRSSRQLYGIRCSEKAERLPHLGIAGDSGERDAPRRAWRTRDDACIAQQPGGFEHGLPRHFGAGSREGDIEAAHDSGCNRSRGCRRGRRRDRLVLTRGQRLDAPAYRRGAGEIGLAAGLVRIELRLDDVARLEEDVDHPAREREFLLAQAVEQRFQLVRDAHHVVEAEHAAAALDRMGRTEDGVELVQAGCVRIEAEEQILHRRQMLCRLLEEQLVELGEVRGHGFTR